MALDLALLSWLQYLPVGQNLTQHPWPARGVVEASSKLSSHVNYIIKCKFQSDELTIFWIDVQQILISMRGEHMERLHIGLNWVHPDRSSCLILWNWLNKLSDQVFFLLDELLKLLGQYCKIYYQYSWANTGKAGIGPALLGAYLSAWP